MVRKKVEGDETQRRAAAHQAEKAGETPSARGETTGASKQRTHMTHRSSLTHEQKVAPIHRGKQDRREESIGAQTEGRSASRRRERDFAGRGDAEPTSEYTEAHAAVFRALTIAENEHGGGAVHLDDIARTAGLSREETGTLLHELMTVHRLVTELQRSDVPDLGPRFETKSRF